MPGRLLFRQVALTALPAAAAPKEAPPLPFADPIARSLSDTCKRADVHEAETPKPAQSRKLGELPPGDTLFAVYNQVEGCMEPVIVRSGDGRVPARGQPEPQRPAARVWR